MLKVLNIIFIFLSSSFTFSAQRVSSHDIRVMISADSIKKHLVILSSDELRGRGTGDIGGERAAHYIAKLLKKYGMKAAGDDGTFYQWAPLHGSIPLPESDFELFLGDKQINFHLNSDYLLYKSGAQTYVAHAVPLVFVGYGIIAPEYDYNDYQSLNAEGKIVVFLSGEPLSSDPNFFDGGNPTVYSYPESKQRIAISRGAKGSIMIPCPRESSQSWERWVNDFSFENITLAYTATSNLSLLMNPASAELLFDGSPFSLTSVFSMDSSHAIQSFPLTALVQFHGKFIERDFRSPNVIGMLDSNRRKSEETYLILSAHYDHLGIGPAVAGDSIYNGAVDNALGVAGLLEIARLFSQLPSPISSSILFFFPTAEEHGVLGSTYYADHPIVPLHKTIANVNIDGLAMFDLFYDVVGIGAQLSTLEEHLKTIGAKHNLKISDVPSQFIASESFARSDQIAFAKAGIPAILISEGLQYHNYSLPEAEQLWIDWLEYVYHTPGDDLHQPINFEATQLHCQFIFEFCRFIAQNDVVIEWNSGTLYINARLQSIAEKR